MIELNVMINSEEKKTTRNNSDLMIIYWKIPQYYKKGY
jgi:hypothetical protein